jgi:hypothetical protein
MGKQQVKEVEMVMRSRLRVISGPSNSNQGGEILEEKCYQTVGV